MSDFTLSRAVGHLVVRALGVVTLTVMLLVSVGAAVAHAGGSDEPTSTTVGTTPPTDDPRSETESDDAGIVSVATVSGLLDPVVVSFVREQIATANEQGDTAIVLRLNSKDATVSDADFQELLDEVAASDVTVGVWIGPSGSQALGRAADLAAAADVVALPAGSRVEVTTALAAGIDLDGRTAVGERIGSDLAVELGLVDNAAAVIGDFILALPDVESRSVGDGIREPVTRVRFSQLGLIDQLFHTVASPAVAYLLLVIGGSLLVFELFTAGVGVAGVVGAVSLLLASYGLDVLPTRTTALALIGVAFLGFAVDVQTGVPRFWSGVGTVALVLGSLTLFEVGPPSWITLLVGIFGTLLAMIAGMPAMVRTRFATPTIGREWMIGEEGTAVAAVAPDGIVQIRDAPWRARTNRATPIDPGAAVRVVAIDGLVLEVEPAEGGAKDYRSRS